MSADPTPLSVLLVPLSLEGAGRLEMHLPPDPCRLTVQTSSLEEILRSAATDSSVILAGVLTTAIDDAPGVLHLLRAKPGTPIVVLSDLHDDTVLLDALARGAAGYLLTDNTDEELLAALRRAARGQTIVDSALGGRIASRVAHQTWRESLIGDAWNLRPRERQVLEALVEGRSNREIAQALYLGEETVKTYLRSVYRKLGVRDRQQAISVTLQRHNASR